MAKRSGRTKGVEAPEAWRSLRVGDRVRIVRLPSGIDAPGYVFQPCTRALYLRLIARGRPQRVSEIDDWGLPWIACHFRSKRKPQTYHFLAINDDSWVRVRSRRPPRPDRKPRRTRP